MAHLTDAGRARLQSQRLGGALAAPLRAVARFFMIRAAQHRLEQYSDHELEDIGLRRADIGRAVAGRLIRSEP